MGLKNESEPRRSYSYSSVFVGADQWDEVNLPLGCVCVSDYIWREE